MGLFNKLFKRNEPGDPFDLYDEKVGHFEKHFGAMHKQVLASPIPWQFGGAIDLWIFPNSKIDGTILTSMQLVANGNTPQKKGTLGKYELAAVLRETPPAESLPTDEDSPFNTNLYKARSLLTGLAHYSEMAILKPGETAEIPSDDPDTPNTYLLFDVLLTPDPVNIVGKDPIAVLLVMEITKSEFEHKQNHGGQSLINTLKQAGAYPYIFPDRDPVV